MSEFFIEPAQDVMIVEQEVMEKTASGLMLPVSESTKMRWGTVLAIGPGRYDCGQFVPTQIKVGDRIMWAKYRSAGENFEHEGKEYLLLREGDVVGRLTRDIEAAPLRPQAE